MKKLFLFLAVGSIAVSAKAQEVTSVMFAGPVTPGHAVPLTTAEMDRMHHSAEARFAHNGAAKTTTGTYSEWYFMWNQNFQTGTSVGYYYATFPDSNVIDNSGTSPYHMYTHGMGMSFDPTDSAYFSVAVNGGALQIPVMAAMPPNQAYQVDSFFTPVRYMRNDPNTTIVDSLVIELVLTQTTAVTSGANDSGAYSFKLATANPAYHDRAYDNTPRWGTLHYNGGFGNYFGAPYNAAPYINDCYFDSVFTTKYRYVVPMTDANKNDTDANGDWNICQTCTPHQATLPLSPVFNLTGNQRQHLVSFISFKSGNLPNHTYPLNTSSAAANWIKTFSGEPNGSTVWWMQSAGNGTGYLGSFQQGLIAQNQIRYNDTGFQVMAATPHSTLIPAFAFNGPFVDVPEHAFHVRWTGTPLAVNNVNSSNVSQVISYPNPANNELNIKFANNQNANVTVTLTNVMGQVVATQTGTGNKITFNTTALAAGVYIFAVESDGNRTTGRVVVAH